MAQKAGWSYADVVAGHKIVKEVKEDKEKKQQCQPAAEAPEKKRNERCMFDPMVCPACCGCGYAVPEKTSGGLVYQKICRNCNGRGWFFGFSDGDGIRMTAAEALGVASMNTYYAHMLGFSPY